MTRRPTFDDTSGPQTLTLRGGRGSDRSARGTQSPADGDSTSEAQSTNESLLQRYRRTRDVRLRDRLVERYRGVVENMARTLSLRVPRSVDVADLEHAGMWGLLQALDNYEPDRNTHFIAFMRLRVRGAMVDELRNLDYLPRLFRRRLRDLDKARTTLRQDLGREPSEGELAEALGITVLDLSRDYGAGRMDRLRPDGEANTDESDAMEGLADRELEDPHEALDRREMVAKIRESLQPIEWKVLQLHYIEGMSGKEVARRLRLSASRICQIHGRVMERLKARLADAE